MSIPCPICSRRFTTVGGLKCHFKVHTRKLTACPLCGEAHKNAQGVRWHCLQMMKKGDAAHAALLYLLSGSRVRKSYPWLREGAFEVLRRGGLRFVSPPSSERS